MLRVASDEWCHRSPVGSWSPKLPTRCLALDVHPGDRGGDRRQARGRTQLRSAAGASGRNDDRLWSSRPVLGSVTFLGAVNPRLVRGKPVAESATGEGLRHSSPRQKRCGTFTYPCSPTSPQPRSRPRLGNGWARTNQAGEPEMSKSMGVRVGLKLKPG